MSLPAKSRPLALWPPMAERERRLAVARHGGDGRHLSLDEQIVDGVLERLVLKSELIAGTDSTRSICSGRQQPRSISAVTRPADAPDARRIVVLQDRDHVGVVRHRVGECREPRGAAGRPCAEPGRLGDAHRILDAFGDGESEVVAHRREHDRHAGAAADGLRLAELAGIVGERDQLHALHRIDRQLEHARLGFDRQAVGGDQRRRMVLVGAQESQGAGNGPVRPRVLRR